MFHRAILPNQPTSLINPYQSELVLLFHRIIQSYSQWTSSTSALYRSHWWFIFWNLISHYINHDKQTWVSLSSRSTVSSARSARCLSGDFRDPWGKTAPSRAWVQTRGSRCFQWSDEGPRICCLVSARYGEPVKFGDTDFYIKTIIYLFRNV